MLALGAVIGVEKPHVGEWRKRGGAVPAGRSARPDPNPKIQQPRFSRSNWDRDGGKGRVWAGWRGAGRLVTR